VDAVLLPVLSGALLGAMTVVVRSGLGRGGDPTVGSAVTTSVAFAVASVLAVPSLASNGVAAGELWPFFLVGLVVPGLSQIVVNHAVQYAGPSRAAILIGMAPLGSVLLAMTLLDEPLRPVLLLGTALIVAGGAALALDPGRPVGFRALGIVLGIGCAALFAGRDNAVRLLARELDPPAVQAATASLAGAALATATFVVLFRRQAAGTVGRTTFRAFLPAGLILGVAYTTLVTSFDRGDVSVVAPLNATQSLWTVVFAALVYGAAEAIGTRTVLAGALVVAGGALIGAFR
jgi:DME family drug/metabolite transporter